MSISSDFLSNPLVTRLRRLPRITLRGWCFLYWFYQGYLG